MFGMGPLLTFFAMVVGLVGLTSVINNITDAILRTRLAKWQAKETPDPVRVVDGR